MQKWEYQTVSLMSEVSIGGRVKRWKLKTINEEDIPGWRKAEGYSSLMVFCNQMGQERWELVSTGPYIYNLGLLLFFKRPHE